MFARMCDTQSPLACLYGKISDIGEAVGRGGREGMAAATGGPSCETEESMACQADLNNNGEVDVDDLVGLFLRWGPQAGPTPADLDGDLLVGVNDLVIIIEMWGAVCLD